MTKKLFTGLFVLVLQISRKAAGVQPRCAFQVQRPRPAREIARTHGSLNRPLGRRFNHRHVINLRIPANADGDSDRLRTAIPIDRGQRSGDRGQRLPSTASRAHSAVSVSSSSR
jgi:hypothetical protein